jgi:hypothetical protein
MTGRNFYLAVPHQLFRVATGIARLKIDLATCGLPSSRLGTASIIPQSIYNRSGRGFSSAPVPKDGLKRKGDMYAKITGVELKFDDESEEEIDLEGDVDVKNIPLLVKRCMLKYPSVVPSELTMKRLKKLLVALPGYQECDFPQDVYEEIIATWSKAYQEKLDEIMFKNLSSYEP